MTHRIDDEPGPIRGPNLFEELRQDFRYLPTVSQNIKVLKNERRYKRKTI